MKSNGIAQVRNEALHRSALRSQGLMSQGASEPQRCQTPVAMPPMGTRRHDLKQRRPRRLTRDYETRNADVRTKSRPTNARSTHLARGREPPLQHDCLQTRSKPDPKTHWILVPTFGANLHPKPLALKTKSEVPGKCATHYKKNEHLQGKPRPRVHSARRAPTHQPARKTVVP